MIIPNLMVSNMAASVAFYRDVLGLDISMLIDAKREMKTDGDGADAVFAILKWNEQELMLQTVASLAEDVPVFDEKQSPSAGGTIYFRGMDPNPVAARAKDAVIRAPFTQWYGMQETYLRDPDGHVICVGKPEGPPPT